MFDMEQQQQQHQLLMHMIRAAADNNSLTTNVVMLPTTLVSFWGDNTKHHHINGGGGGGGGGGGVDPVVVSTAFWDSMIRQFVSLVIGNVLAVIGFTVVTTLAKDQITSMGTMVSETIFGKNDNTNRRRSGAGSGGGLRRPPSNYDGTYKIVPNYYKLTACIVIDVIGSSSGLLPIIGDLTDFIWAPLAALLLKSLYGSNVIFALEFAGTLYIYIIYIYIYIYIYKIHIHTRYVFSHFLLSFFTCRRNTFIYRCTTTGHDLLDCGYIFLRFRNCHGFATWNLSQQRP